MVKILKIIFMLIRFHLNMLTDDNRVGGKILITYKRWRQEDYYIISWLLASMDESFKNKMVRSKFAHEIWTKIKDYCAKSTKYKVKQLKLQLKLTKK
ncbi:Retrovirus-related Pol polyprotein [Arachis hypogaea]|nr:Retrovirus-related Pol polyprotein [Arachis hypogaea]